MTRGGVRGDHKEVALLIVGVEAIGHIGHSLLVGSGQREHVVTLDELYDALV